MSRWPLTYVTTCKTKDADNGKERGGDSMPLSRIEQETIVTFNEKETTATVYTCNGALKRQLSELTKTRGEECTLDNADEYAATYTIPKKWLKVRPNRILTEEQRARLSEWGKHARQNQISR